MNQLPIRLFGSIIQAGVGGACARLLTESLRHELEKTVRTKKSLRDRIIVADMEQFVALLREVSDMIPAPAWIPRMCALPALYGLWILRMRHTGQATKSRLARVSTFGLRLLVQEQAPATSTTNARSRREAEPARPLEAPRVVRQMAPTDLPP
jgi:hypothetical protein